MTEAVVENQDVANEDADFAKGFDQAAAVAPAQTKPEPKQEEKPAEEPKAEVKTEVKEEPKQEEKPAEKTLIAGMTEEEWNAKVKGATAAEIEALRKEIRQNFGQYGEVKRAVQDLTSKLAAGGNATRKHDAESLKAALKRVNEELPGLGDALAADLSEILTGPAAQAEQQEAKEKAEAKGEKFDPEAYFTEKLGPALQSLEARIREDAELRIVKSIHRDFETVIKSPEFGGWLQALSAERQKEVRESEDGLVAADAVTEFKEWREKQKKTKEKNQSRLEGAVTPQGAAQPAVPVTNDEDADFERGFKGASKRYASR